MINLGVLCYHCHHQMNLGLTETNHKSPLDQMNSLTPPLHWDEHHSLNNKSKTSGYKQYQKIKFSFLSLSYTMIYLTMMKSQRHFFVYNGWYILSYWQIICTLEFNDLWVCWSFVLQHKVKGEFAILGLSLIHSLFCYYVLSWHKPLLMWTCSTLVFNYVTRENDI